MINFKQAWLFLIDVECLVRALILHEFGVIHVAQIKDVDVISDQELSLQHHVVEAFSSVIFNLRRCSVPWKINYVCSYVCLLFWEDPAIKLWDYLLNLLTILVSNRFQEAEVSSLTLENLDNILTHAELIKVYLTSENVWCIVSVQNLWLLKTCRFLFVDLFGILNWFRSEDRVAQENYFWSITLICSILMANETLCSESSADFSLVSYIIEVDR